MHNISNKQHPDNETDNLSNIIKEIETNNSRYNIETAIVDIISRNEKEKDETYKQDIEAIQSYFSVNVNVNAQK